MYKINLDGKVFTLDKKTKVIDLIDKNDLSIIAAKINNNVRQLDFEVYYDADINLLRLNDSEATKIYYNSMRYLFAMAVHNLYPNQNVKFFHKYYETCQPTFFLQHLHPNIWQDVLSFPLQLYW